MFKSNGIIHETRKYYIVGTFFKNIGQRLTMRQVVGHIKVKFIEIYFL